MSETLNRLREKRLKLEQDCADIRDTFTTQNDQIRQSLRCLQAKLDQARKQTRNRQKHELDSPLTSLTTERDDQQTIKNSLINE